MNRENDADSTPLSERSEEKPEPKSYYYDDSTGYEVYEPEGSSDEEEEEE
jgi:hypothetical protein